MKSKKASAEALKATSKSATQPVKITTKASEATPSKNVLGATSKVPGATLPMPNTKTENKKAAAGTKQPVPKTADVHSATEPGPKAPKAAPQRLPKIKMVRDSFTFPEPEHKRLVDMKKRLIALGTEVKKGDLVRAGLELLAAMDNQKLVSAVSRVDKLKTGYAKK